jgi:hypothetical protein
MLPAPLPSDRRLNSHERRQLASVSATVPRATPRAIIKKWIGPAAENGFSRLPRNSAARRTPLPKAYFSVPSDEARLEAR